MEKRTIEELRAAVLQLSVCDTQARAYREAAEINDALTELEQLRELCEKLTTEAQESHRRISEKQMEVLQLREQTRWRKYPEEEPEQEGSYLVEIEHAGHLRFEVMWFSPNVGFSFLGVRRWLPLPPAPEVEG